MKTFKILLFLILFIATERFCHKQTHGFRLHKIHSSETFAKKIALDLPKPEEIKSLLDQPFHFLESGVESYAFMVIYTEHFVPLPSSEGYDLMQCDAGCSDNKESRNYLQRISHLVAYTDIGYFPYS